MRSLQTRIITGGFIWAAIAVPVGIFALSLVFNQITDRRFNAELIELHKQVVATFANSQDPKAISDSFIHPAYDRIYSGQYWQIDSVDGISIASRSLFDFELKGDPTRTIGFWEGTGPNGPIRGYSERVITEQGEAWSIAVAASLMQLEAELAGMQQNLIFTFGFVGAFGLACAVLLTTMLVLPLRKLRRDLIGRWDTGQALEPEKYPAEVAPLVFDINELVRRNQNIRVQGRRQAADLAHALKTPLAVLRNELQAIDQTGAEVASSIDALERVEAQITRSLARNHASVAADAVSVRTKVRASVERLERLFRSLPEFRARQFKTDVQDVTLAIEAQDFEEMLGNLLENAFKWADTTVHLSTRQAGGTLEVVVEDDGPGIAEQDRDGVVIEGARLDTSVPGHGLGLSIVNDLTKAYRGSLVLSASEELGGLKCRLIFPLTST